ncbi:MAG: hypothetical protein II693_02625, partial [Bacteroidales bacterium]|nr:hypothetical protein [Bacteroidales bacterium]
DDNVKDIGVVALDNYSAGVKVTDKNGNTSTIVFNKEHENDNKTVVEAVAAADGWRRRRSH